MIGRSVAAVAAFVIASVGIGCGKPAPSEATREASAAPVTASAEVAPRTTTEAPAAGAKLTLTRPPDDVELGSWLRSERLRAKSEGRVLVVYAGAHWCGPCRKFHEALEAGQLDRDLAGVALVTLDADKDRDRMSTAGYTYRFIPYVALVGPTGEPKKNHQIEGGGNANAELVREIRGYVAEAK